MDLKAFIERVGDDKAARLFGVKPRTTKSWRLGDRKPRPRQAKKIVSASKGEVTYNDIYASQGSA